ncbi:hypothetical protein D9619_007839 [Psilocybe cf. subviscida]|uniref:Uncharacterized protein n=1 Tax=Psilocybe cf. subviscida TaxID=2480587 RepID=A0A8H5ESL4_9AGAR|nr:hypothetical protein D9619_007839 [Psilocybe cf. subviscida]
MLLATGRAHLPFPIFYAPDYYWAIIHITQTIYHLRSPSAFTQHLLLSSAPALSFYRVGYQDNAPSSDLFMLVSGSRESLISSTTFVRLSNAGNIRVNLLMCPGYQDGGIGSSGSHGRSILIASLCFKKSERYTSGEGVQVSPGLRWAVGVTLVQTPLLRRITVQSA